MLDTPGQVSLLSHVQVSRLFSAPYCLCSALFVVFSAFVPRATCHLFGMVKNEYIPWIGYLTLEFLPETIGFRHCLVVSTWYIRLVLSLDYPPWEEDNGAYFQADMREHLRQGFPAPLDSTSIVLLPLSIGLINQLIHLQLSPLDTGKNNILFDLPFS